MLAQSLANTFCPMFPLSLYMVYMSCFQGGPQRSSTGRIAWQPTSGWTHSCPMSGQPTPKPTLINIEAPRVTQRLPGPPRYQGDQGNPTLASGCRSYGDHEGLWVSPMAFTSEHSGREFSVWWQAVRIKLPRVERIQHVVLAVLQYFLVAWRMLSTYAPFLNACRHAECDAAMK